MANSSTETESQSEKASSHQRRCLCLGNCGSANGMAASTRTPRFFQRAKAFLSAPLATEPRRRPHRETGFETRQASAERRSIAAPQTANVLTTRPPRLPLFVGPESRGQASLQISLPRAILIACGEGGYEPRTFGLWPFCCGRYCCV